MLTITKRARFCCSHKLSNSKWDSDKNHSVFGQCSNFHGHNYLLEVTVTGGLDVESGMIINLNILQKTIKKEIIEWLDHKHLNTDIEIFKTTIPTVENMVIVIWNKLEAALPIGSLVKVTLYETDDNKAEYSR